MSPAPLPGTSWVLPVGRSLGPRGAGYDVLAGRQVHELDPTSWVLWSLCHGLPGHRAPWTLADVELQATASGLADAVPLLDDLLASGLLALAEPGDDDVLTRVRAVVQLPALGNTADDPDTFSLGTPEVPLVGLDRVTYDVVTSAHRFPDLASAVTSAADLWFRAGAPALAGGDAAALGARVREALPLLLAVGAVHLELAPAGTPS